MSLRVREAMRAEPHTVEPDISLVELERSFLTQRVSGLPVVEDGTLVGIACRSDILRALGYERSYAEQVAEYQAQLRGSDGDGSVPTEGIGARVGERMQELTAADVMVREVHTIEPDAPIEEAAKRMAECRVHRLPVVEGDRLVGILSSLDLARLMAEGRIQAV